MSDADSNSVTITATANGVQRTTSVGATSGGTAWSLSWDTVTDSFNEGSYSSINISVDDGTSKSNSSGSVTWANTLYVDKTPPAAPTITNNTNWTNASSVSVTMSNGADSGPTASGAARTEYKLSGDTVANWTTYPNGGINITNAGVTNIEARTVDNVGKCRIKFHFCCKNRQNSLTRADIYTECHI